jgi:hypothetical protein
MLMKKAGLLFVLIAATPARGRAQQAVEADLQRAQAMYAASNVEGARSIFGAILASKSQVTTEQKVTAYKYLGGYWVLQNKPDSAASYFIAALDYDPFATLDATVFAPDEQAAFARARGKIFKIGIQPVEAAVLDPLSSDPAKRSYTFRVVSTHMAALNVELISLTDSIRQGRETFPTISQNDGPRDIPWTGLINTQRADSGLYEFRVSATDLLNRGNPPIRETHKFRIQHVYAPLEDTLPTFVDVNAGGLDTLKSRLSGLVPVSDGVKGMFIAGFAASLPFVALSQHAGMSGWRSHFAAGIALGLTSGVVASWWGATHREDAAAKGENARRTQTRAAYNAGVRVRNQARLNRTILILRPVGG